MIVFAKVSRQIRLDFTLFNALCNINSVHRFRGYLEKQVEFGTDSADKASR